MTLKTPSSVSEGVRPRMARILAYSSAPRPNSAARDWLASVMREPCLGWRNALRFSAVRIGPTYVGRKSEAHSAIEPPSSRRLPGREGVEQGLAVGAAHQWVDQVLRVRHQAEGAQVGAVDAG